MDTLHATRLSFLLNNATWEQEVVGSEPHSDLIFKYFHSIDNTYLQKRSLRACSRCMANKVCSDEEKNNNESDHLCWIGHGFSHPQQQRVEWKELTSENEMSNMNTLHVFMIDLKWVRDGLPCPCLFYLPPLLQYSFIAQGLFGHPRLREGIEENECSFLLLIQS